MRARLNSTGSSACRPSCRVGMESRAILLSLGVYAVPRKLQCMPHHRVPQLRCWHHRRAGGTPHTLGCLSQKRGSPAGPEGGSHCCCVGRASRTPGGRELSSRAPPPPAWDPAAGTTLTPAWLLITGAAADRTGHLRDTAILLHSHNYSRGRDREGKGRRWGDRGWRNGPAHAPVSEVLCWTPIPPVGLRDVAHT